MDRHYVVGERSLRRLLKDEGESLAKLLSREDILEWQKKIGADNIRGRIATYEVLLSGNGNGNGVGYGNGYGHTSNGNGYGHADITPEQKRAEPCGDYTPNSLPCSCYSPR